MTLAPDAVRTMFDRIAPIYDAMNRVMTAGLDLRWRRLAASAAVRPGDRVLDAACGTGDLAVAGLRAGAASVTGVDFSPRMLERARRKAPAITWVEGDLLALPFADASFDAATIGFGIRNVSDLELGLRELRRVLRPGGRLAILEITRPRGRLRPFFSLWFDRIVPSAGAAPPGRLRLRLPARVGAPVPAGRGARLARRRGRVHRRRVPPARGLDRRPAQRHRRRGVGGVNALAAVDATPGLGAYMHELEVRLAQAVERREGFAAEVAGEALAAGGKRLRPLLCFLSSPSTPDDPPFAAGVATELVHMATLVHDDLVDGARMRRGIPSAWSVFGAGGGPVGRRLPVRVRVRRARRDRTTRPRWPCSPTPASRLARGEALQRVQTRDPETTIEAYLERCALKTGKLFEAACRLGSGGDEALGAYGLALGIAFQIADDILDCAGQTQETGKIPGTDLREGTPTMPLLLAAAAGRRRPARRSPAARSTAPSFALPRPTRSTRSREAALEYAAKARSFLGSGAHRDELEALTYAVVDRASYLLDVD